MVPGNGQIPWFSIHLEQSGVESLPKCNTECVVVIAMRYRPTSGDDMSGEEPQHDR